jgi:hypothetical protein
MSAYIQLKLAQNNNSPDAIKLGLGQIEKLLQLIDESTIDQDPGLVHNALLFQFELFCRKGMFEDARDLLQNLSHISIKIWASFIGVFEVVSAPNTLKINALKVRNFSDF